MERRRKTIGFTEIELPLVQAGSVNVAPLEVGIDRPAVGDRLGAFDRWIEAHEMRMGITRTDPDNSILTLIDRGDTPPLGKTPEKGEFFR